MSTTKLLTTSTSIANVRSNLKLKNVSQINKGDQNFLRRFFPKIAKYKLFTSLVLTEIGVDTDKIMCNIILIFIYLLVAFEEADYQVFSAFNSTLNNAVSIGGENDSWSLLPLFFRK